MSNEILYWVYLGIASFIPLVLGVWLMWRTGKFAFSFWISTIVNALLISAAIYWWISVNDDPFTINFGVMFYIIGALNVAVIELFALISMRNKRNPSDKQTEP